MSDDNSNENQDSRTQIILALIGLFGLVGVALVTNWDKFFPPEPSTSITPSPLVDRIAQSTWQSIGTASTGESVFVDSSSIKKSGDAVDFTYRIGGEVLVGRADCSRDRWYVKKYGKWYSPSGQATQDMMSYVCR